MALGEKKNSPFEGGKAVRKPSKRNLPSKRSINFAAKMVKPIRLRTLIPALIAVIAAAGVFGKVGILDRMTALSEKENEVARLNSQVTAAYAALEEMGDMSDEYAHYTVSGMTEEELTRTSRLKVLDLLERVVFSQVTVSSWSVKSNLLTLSITGADLKDINTLAQELRKEPLVDYCTVMNAATGSSGNQSEVVNAAVTVYLNSTEEVKEGEEDESIKS
ncbi:MAG: hypothetical protein K6E30_02605 [Lachnospiraceae bacterium]|nr:hypothetical protein [Lachnospiraceae bacterium]